MLSCLKSVGLLSCCGSDLLPPKFGLFGPSRPDHETSSSFHFLGPGLCAGFFFWGEETLLHQHFATRAGATRQLVGQITALSRETAGEGRAAGAVDVSFTVEEDQCRRVFPILRS